MTLLVISNLPSAPAWGSIQLTTGWVQLINQLVGPIAPQPILK